MNNNTAVREEKLEERTQVLNLDYKMAAILCYTPVLLISVIAPILFLSTEPKTNQKLRFHAIQGLALSVAAILLSVASSILMSALVAIIGFAAFHLMSLVSSGIGLAFIGISIYCIYCICQGRDFELPYISELARSNA